MRRPYISLLIVVALTSSAWRGISDASAVAAGPAHVFELGLRAAIVVSGVLAFRAMWQNRVHASRLCAFWASLVVGLVISQDLAVGYLRDGLVDRLLATGLLMAVMGTAVWRARAVPQQR